MNQQEQKFINSIKNKIKLYDIPTSPKEAYNNRAEYLAHTKYNNGNIELVDVGIELFLIRKSFSYFLDNYCFVDIPGLGVIPMEPYYFQKEMAKSFPDYRKIVLDKTRQCLTESCYVNIKGKGIISIKDIKPGDMIETLINGESNFTLVENWYNQGEKEICYIETDYELNITCTLDHKIMTSFGWKEAGDITTDDFLLTLNNTYEKVNKIKKKKKKEVVYDITTSTNDFISNGLMVHNCGMSTIFALYAFWKANFFPAEMIDIVSTKQKKAKQFVKKIYSTMNNLPEWMRMPLAAENQQEVVFRHPSGSSSTILSESQSENAGRGDSLSLLILDEAAFYRSDRIAREIVASAQPTLSKTGGQIAIVSTPNSITGRGAYYYEQVQAAKLGERGTKYLEVDWWEIPDDDLISGPKKGYNEILEKAIKEGYFYNSEVKQKYKDYFKPISIKDWNQNEWLSAARQDLGEISYRQEILHEFISSGDRVFNTALLEKILNKTNDPIIKDRLGSDHYEGLWIWKIPEKNKRYILGIDVGSGTGSDSSTIEVIDVETLEQVCEYKGFISTLNFSYLIKKVARYYNEGLVVIESNGIGEAVFNGVYYHENDSYNNVFKIKKTKNNIIRFTGWITDVKTRSLIQTDFIDWFSVPELFDMIQMNSKRLWTQMSSWIWEGNKAIHASGCVSSDTIINCKDGFKQIKDIIIGDEVLTHTGEFKKVYKTFKFKDETKKMLKVKAWGFEELNITSNQEFYINNGEFKNFDNIYDYKSIYANSIFSNKIENEEKIYDDLYLFFIGHLLSNGTISKKNYIMITSENKESEIIFKKYLKYFKDKVEKCYISEFPNEQFKRFIIKDKNLWETLKEIGVSKEKDIINEMRYIHPDQQFKILQGYLFGDACFQNKKNGSVKFNSVSYKLSYFIASILYRNNISFNLNKSIVKRYQQRNSDQWNISIMGKECKKLFNHNFQDIFSIKNNYKETKKYIISKEETKTSKLRNFNSNLLQSKFNQVNQIEWDDYYYDLSVEDDHSYIANGYVVHNSHDDTVMAYAIAMYNKDRAINKGDSFLINDKGEIVDSETESLRMIEEQEQKDRFGVISDDEVDDYFQEQFGVSREDYEWLID